MIQGSVSNDGVPTIVLSVAGRDWLAVVDTGFSGDLELPEQLRDPLHAQFKGQTLSLLAGGQSVIEDAYTVSIEFDGHIVQAEATFVPAQEILVGTSLLRAYRLEVDFPAQTVELMRRGS